MKGIIGKKLGMSQLYDEKGVIIPVTVVEAGPCTVIERKFKEKHGYSALQLGLGSRKAKNVSMAVKGHCEKAGLKETPPSVIREIRLDDDSDAEVGSVIKADLFKALDYVDVTGVSKGKGFQGVVRRFGFKGGRASHGGGWTRKPGSIGCREIPGNVHKNKRLPGHMGHVTRTVQNLRVVRISADDNLIFIRGALPGPNGGVVLIRSAKKMQSN